MSFTDDLQAAQDALAALKSQDVELHKKIDAQQTVVNNLLAQVVAGGPDVSASQGDVDWVKVDSQFDFAFVKVSDGDLLDPTYSSGRVNALRSSGLFGWAPYYYARVASDGNGQRTPRTEAAMAYYFASKQGWGKPGDFPLVYDVEKSAGESTTFQGQTPAKAAAHVVGFIKNYRSLTGHYPFLYTNPDTWSLLKPQLSDADLTTLAKCPLWIAHYGVASPTIPAPWTSWTFWQYTDKGSCPGVSVAVDLNKCALSRTELSALAIT